MHPPGGKGRRERFGAKTSIAHGPFRPVHHLQRSKAAHVVVDELGTGAQGKAHGGVGHQRPVLGEHEAAGHAQVHDQDRTFGEVRNDVFPPSVNGFEYPAAQAGGKIPRWLAKDVRVQDPEVFDGLTGKGRAKASDDGLDFRQFGHGRLAAG